VTVYVNGYRVGPDWRKLGAKPWHVDGAPGITLIIREDVAPLLLYFAREFNRRVEPLVKGWCWSYAYREVRGYPSPSFHAAAVAIDVNAPAHPIGYRTSRSYSRKQIAEVHRILDELDGTVRWGGDYTRRPDSMHAEVIAEPKRAARIAHAFTAAATIPRPVAKPAPQPLPHITLPEDPVQSLIIVGIDKNRKIVSQGAYLYNPFADSMRQIANHADLDRAKRSGAADWPVTMDVLQALGGN
jgi:hypothetical protein